MASLPSLADLSDIEDRLGRDLDASETRKADALLRDASTVVRNYCRREFTRGQTTARIRPRGRIINLPQRPVISVTAIWAVQSFGPTIMRTPLSYWNWPGGSQVFIGDQTMVINGPTLDWDDTDVWADVTYDHGFDEIPDEVITVVANMVTRNIVVPQGGLVDLETIGPYTARYATFTSQGPLGMSEADREVLNRYRTTVNTTVELRG